MDEATAEEVTRPMSILSDPIRNPYRRKSR